jgi:hypothetical protein
MLRKMYQNVKKQDPLLRLRNLKLQRQRCSRLERFFKVEENCFISERTRLLVAWLEPDFEISATNLGISFPNGEILISLYPILRLRNLQLQRQR